MVMARIDREEQLGQGLKSHVRQARGNQGRWPRGRAKFRGAIQSATSCQEALEPTVRPRGPDRSSASQSASCTVSSDAVNMVAR